MSDSFPEDNPQTAAGGAVRILHLEDSPFDAELVQQILHDDGLAYDVAHVPNRAAFEALIEKQRFDLIICDHGLPGYDGFAALQFARSKQPETPIIMLSGSLDEVQAVESLKNGATDYILKQKLTRLSAAVRRALREAAEQKTRAAAEQRVREQANLINLTSEAIVMRTLDDTITSWNRGAETVFGWEEGEAMGKSFGALLHADVHQFEAAKRALLQTDGWLGEFYLRNKSGDEVIVFSRWNLLRGPDGNPQMILSANMDVTEKKRLEAMALRAQRMDSIGALAGGIAHDLNNALAPVLMSADLLKVCDDKAAREQFLDIISASAKRATGMVKQILGFARGAGGKAGPLALTAMLREMVKMVRETFPKSIAIKANIPDKNLWQVQGDATELHQVLLNLCVNARDAIAGPGQITLTATNVRLDGAAADRLTARPGPYVLLSVADTGTGIPANVLPHIFEPFFTTKKPDSGTGLGLSTVAAIVKNHNGFLDIKSEVGKGTEFRVYLPALEARQEAEGDGKEDAPLPVGRGELILVMDDEEAVRELAKATLESYGYQVLTAQNGVQGLALFEEHKDKIRLVVSDTDMPVMNGQDAIRAIKQIRPDVPIIIASGGKRDSALLEQTGAGNLTSLGKPFNLEQLLIAVAMVIQQ
jgi:PAS domain S-box-containing protein